MAKKKAAPETAAKEEKKIEEQPAEETKAAPENAECEALKKELAETHDRLLRTLAEFDNFKKRTAREKEDLYFASKADVVKKPLPVFDNLQRALDQETADEAYKKGVEMTMTGLREIMTSLGVKEFGEAGETFDPAMHNAVMHCEDDSLGENVIAEVFQKGFVVGEKVIRFAMVKVAN